MKLQTLAATGAVLMMLAGCSPETRCVRGIDSARAALDQVREQKSGLGKVAPALLKADGLLAAAEAARATRNYDACIDNVAKARAAMDEAR